MFFYQEYCYSNAHGAAKHLIKLDNGESLLVYTDGQIGHYDKDGKLKKSVELELEQAERKQLPEKLKGL